MAISDGTAGAWVSTTTRNPTVTLPTHAAGDMLLVRVAWKSATPATDVAVCNTSGWAKIGQYSGGSTASGNGIGSVVVAVFWKVATSSSETNPVIEFDDATAPTPGAYCPVTYSKGASDTWVTPVGDGGPASGTSYAGTIQSHVSATAGDMLDAFIGAPDNIVLTNPTVTQAGLTLDTVTEYPATALSTTDSNDFAADGRNRLATAGTSSAAAVVSGTASGSETNSVWCTRLRVTTVDNRDASIANTGGGVAVVSGRKNGARAVVATGGGVAVVTTTGAHSASIANTGGGVAVASSRKGGLVSAVSTGGGVAVVDGAKGVDNRNASVVATGGGVAAVSSHKGALVSTVSTGGGVAAAAGIKGALTSTVAAGGGISVVSALKAQAVAIANTGGGVAVIASVKAVSGSVVAVGGGVAAASVSKGGLRAVVATGGGVSVVDYTRTGGGDDRFADVIATGGGVVVLETRHAGTVSASATGAGSAIVSHATQRAVAVAATGAGSASPSVLAARAFAAAMTGGGVAVINAEKAADDSVVATGGGVVVIDYTRSGNHKSVSVVATGGGIGGLDVLTGRIVAPTMTGGGVVVIGVSNPSVSVVATGGGVFTKGATPLPEIESPIGMSIDSGPVGVVVATDAVAIVSITTDSPVLYVADTSILP